MFLHNGHVLILIPLGSTTWSPYFPLVPLKGQGQLNVFAPMSSNEHKIHHAPSRRLRRTSFPNRVVSIVGHLCCSQRWLAYSLNAAWWRNQSREVGKRVVAEHFGACLIRPLSYAPDKFPANPSLNCHDPMHRPWSRWETLPFHYGNEMNLKAVFIPTRRLLGLEIA
ncbi:hypothetical protein BJX64DRAFT_136925 [Aspergillus heterothallicus]